MSNKLERKCSEYVRNRLRAPSVALVKKWGRQLKMTDADIDRVSQHIELRHRLGN